MQMFQDIYMISKFPINKIDLYFVIQYLDIPRARKYLR
jgi:hypothetical protein